MYTYQIDYFLRFGRLDSIVKAEHMIEAESLETALNEFHELTADENVIDILEIYVFNEKDELIDIVTNL